MKKNILILYTAVGKGHKTMAENIATALKYDYEVDLLDLFEFQADKMIERGTKLYLWILDNAPWVWSFLYSNRIFLFLTLPWRTKVAGTKVEKILNKLKSKHYDAVVSTQVNPSAIVSYLKQKGLYKGKFVISFSDYHLHPYWIYDNADHFFANTAEQKKQMLRMGYPDDKITVVGMAMPYHFDPKEEEMREKYKVEPNQKVVLIIGGTMGYKLNPRLIMPLTLMWHDLKVFVVCGNNKAAEEEIREFFKLNKDVHVYGYIDFLQELYVLASVVISKPGGMTTAECLQRSIPLAIYDYLPGQEAKNTKYLRKHKLVLPGTKHVLMEVVDELQTGEFKKQLHNNHLRFELTQGGSTVKHVIDSLVKPE